MIELNFTQFELDLLWNTSFSTSYKMSNFIKENPDRFELLSDKPETKTFENTMFFFDRLLDLKIYQAYNQEKGNVYWDCATEQFVLSL